MAHQYHVFLSYSRNDAEAAANLRAQLARHGLRVFNDDETIRAGELWLDRLQEAVEACRTFVILVGRDGVQRWVGAETQVALNRYFAPHEDAQRLAIFPILLDGIQPHTLPAFVRLFQTMPWNGADALPERLLDDIRDRTISANKEAAFTGCPFVGLAAFRMGSGAPVLRAAEGDAGCARLLRYPPRQPDRALAGDQRQQRFRQVLADERRAATAGGAGLALAAPDTSAGGASGR